MQSPLGKRKTDVPVTCSGLCTLQISRQRKDTLKVVPTRFLSLTVLFETHHSQWTLFDRNRWTFPHVFFNVWVGGWVGGGGCVRAGGRTRASAHADTGTVTTHCKLKVHHEGNDLEETDKVNRQRKTRDE